MRLRDRRAAGKQLAEKLLTYASRDDAIVLALPRGGVPVGFEIARRLHIPLDVFLVRKLGLPGQEELAIGAIAMGGVRVLNEEVLAQIPISHSIIEKVAVHEEQELRRRYRAYRDDRPLPTVRGRQVILVDDGVATGSSMRAAIMALRQQSPKRIIAAIPVAPPTVYEELPEADEIVCLMTPEPFNSVGSWYEEFPQTTDEEVRQLLAKAESLVATEAA